jgi:hypothetical protein
MNLLRCKIKQVEHKVVMVPSESFRNKARRRAGEWVEEITTRPMVRLGQP